MTTDHGNRAWFGLGDIDETGEFFTRLKPIDGHLITGIFAACDVCAGIPSLVFLIVNKFVTASVEPLSCSRHSYTTLCRGKISRSHKATHLSSLRYRFPSDLWIPPVELLNLVLRCAVFRK